MIEFVKFCFYFAAVWVILKLIYKVIIGGKQ